MMNPPRIPDVRNPNVDQSPISAQTAGTLRGFVFIRPKDVAGLGHVGWGIELSAGRFFFGATEAIPGMKSPIISPGEPNGWWSEKGNRSDMLRVMKKGKTLGYEKFKTIRVQHAKAKAAERTARRQESAGYALIGNNCMTHAFDILTAYGAGIPWVQTTIPNFWYALIDGRETML